MGTRGAIAPTAKKVWGKSPPQEFCYVNYECAFMQVAKGALPALISA